jgi:hypothetical protein
MILLRYKCLYSLLLCRLVKLILLMNHGNVFEMIIIFMMLTCDFILMKNNFDKDMLML